jgi:D-glycero-alpha-D-manno-heptose-7-phosphate kinase
MKMARAPVRISFAGGGTDIKPFCSRYGGAVIAMSIRAYVYAQYPSYNPQPSDIEQVVMSWAGVTAGLSLHTSLPPKAGLGGSAACYAAAIKVMRPRLSREQIARTAFHLERKVQGIAGGCQDQWMAAYGGLNFLRIHGDAVWIEEQMPIPDDLEKILVLVYLGPRENEGQDIIKDQLARDPVDALKEQCQLAEAIRRAIKMADYPALGELVDRAWAVKRKFSPLVSNWRIDEFYAQAKRQGAVGGKLTGAGGGGYMLLVADPANPSRLKNWLTEAGYDFREVEADTEGTVLL